MRNPLRSTFAVLLCCALVVCVGCSRESPSSRDSAAAPGGHKHEHRAPHDGTAVVLGDEAYHLEFVLDAAAGKLAAYVLDGEMENFVRIAAPSFDVTATVAGAGRVLRFDAVANRATGETIGDTSQFEAQADWLKTAREFDAVLPTIAIRGTTFTGVAFNFPKGNDAD